MLVESVNVIYMLVHGELSYMIVAISVVFVGLSILLVRRVEGGGRQPTVLNYFMIRYFIFIFIGSVYLNFDVSKLTYSNLNNELYLFNIWWMCAAVLFFVPLGALIANSWLPKIWKFNNVEYIVDIDKYVNRPRIALYDKIVYVLFLTLAVIVLYFYRSALGGALPIEEIFAGGSSKSELAFLRSEATNNFGGRLYVYKLFMKTIPIYLMIYWYLRAPRIRSALFSMSLIFLYAVLVSLIDLQKAPVFGVLIILILSYLFKHGVFSSKQIMFLLGLFLVLLYLLYAYFMGLGDRPLMAIMEPAFKRIFVYQTLPFYYYQDYLSDNGLLYGASFPNPMGMFPFEHRRLTVEVMNHFHGGTQPGGTVGSMPAVFFADWVVNFGKVSALFSMVVFGFILRKFDLYFKYVIQRYRSLYFLASYIFVIFFLGEYIGTSFVGLILSEKLVLLLILPFGLLLFKNWIISLFPKAIKCVRN